MEVNTNVEIPEVTFAYQVNTRMPIMGLSIGSLKAPSTVKLTKNDVLICLKKAPVFRRFKAGEMERVGTGNLDRLHREEHLTPEEYEKVIDKENDNRGKVKEVPVEDKKETEPVKEEVKAEEPKVEETPVVEEPKVEEEPVVEPEVEEEKEETTDEVNEEEVSEEVVEAEEAVNEEETTEVEEESTEESTNNKKYYNKKKHNR